MSHSSAVRCALPLLAAVLVESACASPEEDGAPQAMGRRNVLSESTFKKEGPPRYTGAYGALREQTSESQSAPSPANLPDEAANREAPGAQAAVVEGRALVTLYSLPSLEDAVSGAVTGSAVYGADGARLWQPAGGMEVRSISCAGDGGFWAHVREHDANRSWLYRVAADGAQVSAERVFDARGGAVNLLAGFEVTRCAGRVLYATPAVWGAQGELLQPSSVQSADGAFRWSSPDGDVRALACGADGGVIAHVIADRPVRTWLYRISPDATSASADELFDSSVGLVNGMAGADVVRCGEQLLYTVPALTDQAGATLAPSSVRSSDGTIGWDAPDGSDVRAVSCRSAGGFTVHVIGYAPLRSWIFEVDPDGSQASKRPVFDSSSGYVSAASGFDLAACE